MVSALMAASTAGSASVGMDQGQCPVCGCHYDSGKQRKLLDTNCGHARCFKCMFVVEQCPLCHLSASNPSKHQSCISRESGFQSFAGSVSSIYSSHHLPMMPNNNNEMMTELDRQSSTGSLLSLMSAQSALNMMAPPSIAPASRYSMYDPSPSMTASNQSFHRTDQKRHSLTSLSRYQAPPSHHGSSSASSISSRNSYMRRSAIIPRNNRRSLMTSIIEQQQRKPIFFKFGLNPLPNLKEKRSVFCQ